MLPPEYRSTVFLLEHRCRCLPSAFAIVTAWNPHGGTASEDANKAADEALRGELELRQISYFRATGASPDLSHREPGWAVSCSFPEALELGRRFAQLALWWIDGDHLQLVDCTHGRRESLDSFRRRVVDEMPDGR